MTDKRNDLSWGRLPWKQNKIKGFSWADDQLPKDESILPYGRGRSYGDSCINEGGTIIRTQGLNHFIEFDRQNGLLTCESGVTLEEILNLIVPKGWFLPVTPGTKYVTVGGAIANDVHGKNHHVAGCFGNHVTEFELLRSDGTRLICSPSENKDWFCATIGGLGLTGLVTKATIKLKAIAGPLISTTSTRYNSLEEFLELSRAADGRDEYMAAWVDCMAKGSSLGKGHFITGNHSNKSMEETGVTPSTRKLTVPFSFPNFAMNSLSIKAFNFAYYWRQLPKVSHSFQHYDPFFYPLDAVLEWNRVYGTRGFFQYQCVVPNDDDKVIRQVMDKIARSNAGSALTVLKEFGDVPSPGLLSFPTKGITFALDFANDGPHIREFLNGLDRLVMDSGGKVYPAKDARMSEAAFKSYYPNWSEFEAFIDPKFSSSFWRRVTGK